MDLFKFSNFSFGWNGDCKLTDFYSSLEGYREWEGDSEIGREREDQ